MTRAELAHTLNTLKLSLIAEKLAVTFCQGRTTRQKGDNGVNGARTRTFAAPGGVLPGKF
jgi:hypothetical protein